ncbi:MAG TPA: calcium-binding protein, partial [Opitutus sp.]|nr:calcium-binding protein [Opitutus sp.]
AKIDLASVIKVGGSIVFTFNQDGSWRVDVPNETTSSNHSSLGAPAGALTADFFGLATISVWGWFQSDGQFNVHVRGSISLGGGGTGLFGTVTFDAAYVKALNPETNFEEYRLTLSASISGSAKLFGITLGGFDASFSYDSLTGKLSVRVTVHFLFFSKSKTFTLGYFKLEAPPPFIPAGDLIDGKFWLNGADQVVDGVRGDGVLYLNMGNRAGNRSNVDYLTDSEDETFLIRHVSGSPDDANGETIEIIGLGRKATYSGVKKIVLLDTAGGENVLILGSDGPTSVGGVDIGGVNYVLSPFYANGGSGEDLIVYYGEGDRALGTFKLSATTNSPTYTQMVVMNGNGGEDYLEIGSLITGTGWLTGGAGDDTLIGGNSADTLNGGADNDRIVGRLGDDLISGGSGIDTFYWAAGDGADSINGGGNSTDPTWAPTDAVPLNADTLVFIATNLAETITLTSTGSNSATLLYVRGLAESVSLSLSFVEVVDAHLGQGANTAVVNDLLSSGITTLEFRVSALVPTIDAILRGDALPTASMVAPDLFRFTGSNRDDEYVALIQAGKVQVTQKNAGATVAVATLHGVTRPGTANDDILELKGAGANDKLDAQGLTANLIHVKLFGEAGNDRLIGTPFVDDLQGGAGDDTYTSGAGVDLFTDTDAGNTLIEVFDRDMSLFNNLFVSGTLSGFTRTGITDASGNPVDLNRPTGPNTLLSSYSDAFAAGAEVENLAPAGTPIFSHAILVGGAGNNVITVGTSTGTLMVGSTAHTVTPWTGEATLDNRSNGGSGADGYYIVHLSGAEGATINIADSAVTAASLLGVAHL